LFSFFFSPPPPSFGFPLTKLFFPLSPILDRDFRGVLACVSDLNDLSLIIPSACFSAGKGHTIDFPLFPTSGKNVFSIEFCPTLPPPTRNVFS